MAKNQRISVTWSDDLQQMAEVLAKKYAAEMGVMGISTRVSSRPGGEETFNRSGVIAFALMKLTTGESE